jgi:hypothetical protein
MGRPIDWKDIAPGNKPVCLVGAGFQKAALKNPLPSTNDIVEKTIQNKGEQFPILSALCNSNISIHRCSVKEDCGMHYVIFKFALKS